ncbi:MAG: DUF3108 domain-containing protein [Gammaproteobacteria bacterium]|nr:DUF3108 domain-containing protein [Gammaproteobacteria bacterium]
MPSSRHVVTLYLSLGALLSTCVLSVYAADPHRPSPFSAVYTVATAGVGVGRMTRTFALAADETYRFSAVIEAEGLAALLKPTHIDEQSTGRWPDAHPVPLRYSHTKRSGTKQKAIVIDFDWQAGRSHATINTTPIDAPLEAGAIDKLNYQLALMRDLASGITDLVYRVADADGAKTYRLERRAEARVDIRGVVYDTVPVVYARDDGRRTELWCARQLGYLPVRIEYTEKDGKRSTAVLESLDAPP